MVAPDTVVLGGFTWKNSCVPTDVMMLNGALVAPVRPPAAAVSV